jgi:RHS repeat-associated protein
MKIKPFVYFIVAAFLLCFSIAYSDAATPTLHVNSPAAESTITGAFDLSATATFNPTGSPLKGVVTCTIKDTDDIPWVNYDQYLCYSTNCAFSYSGLHGGLIYLDSGAYTLACTTTGGAAANFAFTVETTPHVEPANDKGKPEDAQDPCSGNTGAPAGGGSPVRSVNKVNLNLYVADTPIWYKPPYGPGVSITMSNNSLTQTVANSPFGTKWQSNYSSYITENGSNVTVYMPDGREDVYTANGGTYTKPFNVFNTLVKVFDKRYALTFLDGTVYTYAVPAGTVLTSPMLIEIRDSYNQPLSIVYDSSGRIWKIADALSRETIFSYYSGTNLVQTVTDPFGRSATYEYTGTAIQKVTDMAGFWASYTYDANGFISSITTQQGVWLFKIEPSDGLGSPAPYPDPNAAAPKMGKKYRVTITNPQGKKEEYFYDGANTWYVSPRDYVEYVNATTNNMNRAAKTYYMLERYPAGSSTPRGRITKSLSAEGRPVTYYYDDATGTNLIPGYSYTNTGKVATVTDGNSHTTKYTFNSNGRVTSVTDAKSNQTVIGYDPGNNIDATSVTNGLGAITYTYNTPHHDISQITDRMSYITAFSYNGTGQLATVTEAQGTANETLNELIYDSTKKTLKDIKKAGVVIVSLTHDNIGRVQSVTYPDGVVITYAYEKLDQVKTITYPDQKTVQIVNNATCPYLVDSITERAGNIRKTSYFYDSLKRLDHKEGPDGIFKYGYDNNSNLTTFTDANNKVTTLGYDLDNNLSLKTYSDTTKFVSYTYDQAGLLKTFTNGRSNLITYGYDENNNLTSITYPIGTTNVVMKYDSYNRLWKRSDSIGVFQFTFDANNRLTGVAYPWDNPGNTMDNNIAVNNTVQYGYDSLNRLTAITPLVGSQLTYGYNDPLGRLKTVTKGTDSFTYNYVGNSTLNASLVRPTGGSTVYQYNDPLKKLTSIGNKKLSGDVINQFDYTYNHLDLKASETITNGDPVTFAPGTKTWSYNNLNQLTNTGYSYDADGNMLTAYTPGNNALTMTYDAENRPATATYADGQGTHTTTYSYTGDGLLARVVKTGTPASDTRYVRAGFLPIQERDASNNVTREYFWGSNMGGGIEGLLTLRQNNHDYYYLYDGKGNVAALIDSTETPVAAYRYDPFGVLMKKTATIDQPYMFSTKIYDVQTGLSDYSYRFYNAAIGKWMTRDRLGEYGDVNLYRGMRNNAVNFIDPLGLVDNNQFPSGTDLAHSANRIPTRPGEYSIASHGNPQCMVVNGQCLRPRQFADWLKTQKDYEPGTPLRLLGCRLGQGNNSFGQRLANELGVYVTAPDNYAWFEWSGDVFYADKPGTRDEYGNELPGKRKGSEVLFRPR